MRTEQLGITEKRKSPRVSVDAPVVVECGGQHLVGRTVNVSLFGAYCVIQGPIPELSDVKLTFVLPIHMPDSDKTEHHIAEVHAVTVRVEDTDDRHAAAFMFEHMGLDTEWVIGKFILDTISKATAD